MEKKNSQLPPVQLKELREMVIQLMPEYRHHIVDGGDYVYLTDDASQDKSKWDKILWLDLVITELPKRIYVLGHKPKGWLKDFVNKTVWALIADGDAHIIDVLYAEYRQVEHTAPKYQKV